MIASDDCEIESIAPECESESMASVSRRFDAIIASDNRDIAAIASECESDAIALISRRFDQ